MSSTVDIVQHYRLIIEKEENVAIPVAVIRTLLYFIENSNASTESELLKSLENAINLLKTSNHGSLPVEAGCNLFKRFLAITTEHIQDISVGKQMLLERGKKFVERTLSAREEIAQLGARFIKHDMTVLVHSYSRVVLLLLQHAAVEMGIQFSVLVTEARPTCSGIRTARELKQLGIPVKMVVDSAIACAMERTDLVLLGTESVTENGGLVSQVGTYQVAMIAKAARRPCYAVAESYKFIRRLPLGQTDLPMDAPTALHETKASRASLNDASFEEFDWLRPNVDYTPPEFIQLLITDLGVLTPAGVGDELFRLYG